MKISELAEQTGLTASAIRFYERSGLLPSPERGSNGYRSYAEIDVQRVYVIRIAQSLGFPLDSVRIFFDATPAGPDDGTLQSVDDRLREMDKMIGALQTQRQDLRMMRATLIESWATGGCIDPSAMAKRMKTQLHTPGGRPVKKPAR
ncbi:MerR family transcriptional regulator [Herbaspirillum rhizosphaerae]|uniref:MerR family transcriptional regulator n=1 Tax=Herbaspirillum rhizosphaerae TaxID=346179 RepID=UPI00067DE8B3|nr:MerR family transcriptional regulator [Herbaspirillum rhizosphaerae]